MKYLKYYKLFESVENVKIYDNIDDINDYDYYQIPFSWFKEHKEFGDDYKVYLFDNFIYDYITDNDISIELENDISDVDLSKGWESITSHSKNNESNIHTKRIAKIVEGLLNNKPLIPISFWISEIAYQYDCYNFIEDGNHRLRALQYLKYSHFPAYVYGSHEKFVIDELKNET
jgi:hypothetical protein